MTGISWHGPLEKIIPFVFKIKTPSGIGTGFQISYIERTELCGIATADHVIAHEDEWEEPIRIIHHLSGKSVLLKSENRMIWRYPDKDLAFILFHKSDLPIIPKPLSLINKGHTVKQGVEVGWCGFPEMALDELCFFAGHISAQKKESSYLVDGVAINGVSGGPAFYIEAQTNEPKFFGVISAYRPNRATGEVLPGLCIVRSVDSYQTAFDQINSIEEAKEKEKLEAEAKLKEEVEKEKLEVEAKLKEEVEKKKHSRGKSIKKMHTEENHLKPISVKNLSTINKH